MAYIVAASHVESSGSQLLRTDTLAGVSFVDIAAHQAHESHSVHTHRFSRLDSGEQLLFGYHRQTGGHMTDTWVSHVQTGRLETPSIVAGQAKQGILKMGLYQQVGRVVKVAPLSRRDWRNACLSGRKPGGAPCKPSSVP